MNALKTWQICWILVGALSAADISAEEPIRELNCDPEHLSEYDESHPDRLMCDAIGRGEALSDSGAADSDSYSGDWVVKDGVVTCDGFLTRRRDKSYCSAVVPDDWKPFFFNGKRFYVQPLT